MTNTSTLMEQAFFFNVIRGIFDSDGSFEAKIYLAVDKPVSFYVNIIFPHKGISVIEMILDKLGYPPGSYISSREHILESGNITESNSKSIAFSNPTGQRLLTAWQQNPPIAPTKFLDFQICLVLVQVNKVTALEVVNSLCPGYNLQDLRIASFALMHLRYQMFGKVKENSNPNLLPIEEHYKTLKATPYEIQQATLFGNRLYEPIYADFVRHVNSISISNEAYFLGLHIGDGSFFFSTYFNEKGTSFKAGFGWNLSDCVQNRALLEAVKRFLESKGIVFTNSSFKKYKNSIQLIISTTSELKKFAALLEEWGAYDAFADVRKNQYTEFVEAMQLYLDPSFRNDFKKCSRFIELKWTMNSGTNYKKKGSLNDDMVKLKRWFDTKNTK
jgi:hypothetical protein